MGNHQATLTFLSSSFLQSAVLCWGLNFAMCRSRCGSWICVKGGGWTIFCWHRAVEYWWRGKFGPQNWGSGGGAPLPDPHLRCTSIPKIYFTVNWYCFLHGFSSCRKKGVFRYSIIITLLCGLLTGFWHLLCWVIEWGIYLNSTGSPSVSQRYTQRVRKQEYTTYTNK